MFPKCLFILVVLCLRVTSADFEQLDVEAGYNINERPREEGGGPLLIQASINVRNILDVDEKSQIVSLETTLRFYWRDTRIKTKADHIESNDTFGQYTSLNPAFADKIWMPDIFIDQAKALRIPTYYTKPASIRVYTDSLIRYSSRFNFDVACNMNFRLYPVDEQFCTIKFESFGLQSTQAELRWIPGGMTINKNISLAQFYVSAELKDEYATDYYDIKYPGLELQLHLTRLIGYHIVQTYIPSAVFVVLAWLSLFVPVESVPGRVGMGMTTLLTLTAMFSSVRQNVPKVSYVSMLDIWMLICLIFVFCCLLEFIVVTSITRRGKKRQAEKFELVCKTMVPILFIFINIVYWSHILS